MVVVHVVAETREVSAVLELEIARILLAHPNEAVPGGGRDRERYGTRLRRPSRVTSGQPVLPVALEVGRETHLPAVVAGRVEPLVSSANVLLVVLVIEGRLGIDGLPVVGSELRVDRDPDPLLDTQGWRRVIAHLQVRGDSVPNLKVDLQLRISGNLAAPVGSPIVADLRDGRRRLAERGGHGKGPPQDQPPRTAGVGCAAASARAPRSGCR